MTPRRISHKEYTYHGHRVILDTAQIYADKYETMLMYANGEEIASATSTNGKDAYADFRRIYFDHPDDGDPNSSYPLPAKYAKLRDDLRQVHKIGQAAADSDTTGDGGTCNFDAPALCLPRWNASLVKRACKEAGGGCYEWRLFGQKHFVIVLPTGGQAMRRTLAAEAMTKALSALGYDAFCYQAAD